MPSKTISIAISVKDRAGNITTKAISVVEQSNTVVAGGYYVSGNGNMTADTTGLGMNLKGFTQYHSFADNLMIPGYNNDYLKTFGTSGIWGNYVCELKHYGNSNTGVQTLTVEGVKYTVPAPNMLIQKRAGTTFPKAYGYEQIWTGQCDGLLHKLALQIKNMGNVSLNVQLASEFDTDHEFGTTEAGIDYTWAQADARAVKALSYMIDFIKSKGISSSVTFTVGMGGFDRSAWLRMHPESLMPKIDYLQWNAYKRSATATPYSVFMRTKSWSDADLGPLAKAKNIIIAEWGSPASYSTVTTNDQVVYISQVPDAIKKINQESTTGQIVMMNYFNSNPDWATLNPKAAGLQALKTAYSQSPFIA